MEAQTFTLESKHSTDTHQVNTLLWASEKAGASLIHICHGMAEFAGRYQAIAELLVAAGYHVIAHDHRGHGQDSSHLGHYSDSDGWQKVVNDIGTVHEFALKTLGADTPIILLGHSMGSFIAQQYAIEYGKNLSALILSGSNLPLVGLMRSARFIAKIEAWRQGPKGKSKLIDKLSFGSFNKAFKPSRTDFDWLSRDNEIVDAYVASPLCGFLCSNQLWLDMLGGLVELGQPTAFKAIPSDLPIYLLSGELDPVSASTNGVRKLAERLQDCGQSEVSCNIYDKGRHEILNEINREEVLGHLIKWLNTLPI